MIRSTSVFAALLVLGAFACERKEEPKPGETTTTSGTMRESDQGGGAYRGGATVTGSDTTGGTANTTGTTGTSGTISGTTETTGAAMAGDHAATRDAGVTSDTSQKRDGGVSAGSKAKGDESTSGATKNRSTTLGDGTSGQYTGGKGTYGGKATQGTSDDAKKQPVEEQDRTKE